MFDDKGIMKYENILPPDFDGVFKFTNWTKTDFIGVWGGKQYHFPAESTTPMIIPEHSPVEVQNIRKKFAKDLAEREFNSSQQYKNLMKQERNPDGTPRLNGIHSAGTYTLNDLTPFIQRCLEPLPAAQLIVTQAPVESTEAKLSRDEKGNLNTEAIDRSTSLRDKALNAN